MKRICLLLILLLAVVPATGWAKSKETKTKEAERISDAARVLDEIMAAPDKGIPEDLLGRAQCVAIIPSMVKAAFIVGGQHGKGVVSCRHGGGWGPPSMLTLSGGSFGLQLGGQGTDVVMLVMNRRGIDYLIRDKFEIGADASAAAGPVGREATANTDASMRAEILTYSRSRGLFAGLSLKGAVVKPDKDGNSRLYGRPVEARSLLLDANVAAPAAARPLLAALGRHHVGRR